MCLKSVSLTIIITLKVKFIFNSFQVFYSYSINNLFVALSIFVSKFVILYYSVGTSFMKGCDSKEFNYTDNLLSFVYIINSTII